ncbi:hypothetical protein AMK59_856 [Oryctes borbonicus]|uniref:RNA polymerase I-specific transcription initiation factor RRN3 n=1 Tax=Oryctes borbonicus TaxID=1629725 RepID=A0A0T6BCG9_9SCAR|nr:hypothetical protein AMK59_856 [Oryctes borbonicus]
MDVDEDNKPRMLHPIGNTLDVCMDKLFNYIIMECHNTETSEIEWAKTKRVYQDIISVFDKVILPTYNLHHVQFIMFLLCSLKTSLAEAFLNYLWKKVCTPSTASVIRQAAVAYIASFIARASIVPLSMLKGTLQQMSEWIHSYISAQDGLECVNTDVRIHSVFYSVCQALFYVIAFRQSDLVKTRRNIGFLNTLSLGKIVTCRLNPLRVCHPVVVQNFAAVTRTYQIAYCYSIIEHNARSLMPTIYQTEKGSSETTDNILDSFFPFDPYILNRSGEKITPFYLNYKNFVVETSTTSKHELEDDDFLYEHDTKSSDYDKFSYGTSPGFKMKENG